MVSSGVIALGGSGTVGPLNQSVNVELGQSPTAFISMNDANARVLAGIPSGTISMSDFYGKSYHITVNLTISVNTSNYNLFVAAGSPVAPATVTVTINSGVYVYGTSAANYAFDTGTGWAAGTTITIINNGFIIGSAGNGALETATSSFNGYNGNPGGPALRAQYPVSVTNNNTIAGGGGGGGSGGNWNSASGGGWVLNFGGNGSGGVSSSPGSGSNGGTGLGNAPAPTSGSYAATTGGTANHDGTRFGITGTPDVFWNTSVTLSSGCGAGGSGGGWGAYGSNGQNARNNVGTFTGGVGGACGSVVISSSNVTWTTNGLRYGIIDGSHYNYFGGTISYTSNNINKASISLSFTSTGFISDTGLFTSTATVPQSPQEWYRPLTTGIGGSYWIRATALSGTVTTGTMGTWISISPNPVWTVDSLTTTSTKTCTVLFEISTSAGGSPIVSSGTYVLTSTHT